MTEAERRIVWVSSHFYTSFLEPGSSVPFEPLIETILQGNINVPIIRERYNVERISKPDAHTTLLCGDDLKIYRKDPESERRCKSIVLGVTGLRDALIILERLPLPSVVAIDTDVNHHGYEHNGYRRGDLLPTQGVVSFLQRISDKGIPCAVYATQPVPSEIRTKAKKLDSLVAYHNGAGVSAFVQLAQGRNHPFW